VNKNLVVQEIRGKVDDLRGKVKKGVSQYAGDHHFYHYAKSTSEKKSRHPLVQDVEKKVE